MTRRPGGVLLQRDSTGEHLAAVKGDLHAVGAAGEWVAADGTRYMGFIGSMGSGIWSPPGGPLLWQAATPRVAKATRPIRESKRDIQTPPTCM